MQIFPWKKGKLVLYRKSDRMRSLACSGCKSRLWIIRELRQEADIVRVFPFSSQNKDMSTIIRENGKEHSLCKGKSGKDHFTLQWHFRRRKRKEFPSDGRISRARQAVCLHLHIKNWTVI